MTNKPVLKIEFDNEKALKHFAYWLCEQGEQDYWIWMECREQEESGNITGTNFNYHHDNKFLGDKTIRVTCGRMDNKE